jgi:NitT/TauT family transport system substrate-binding protein
MNTCTTRRRFVAGFPLACATAAMIDSESRAAEPSLEITSVRMPRVPAECLAPQYIADQLLRDDDIVDVQYVDMPSSAGFEEDVAKGTVDFCQVFVAALVTAVGRGRAIAGLAPIHVGCIELIANDRIRTIADLKGKRVGVTGIGASDHLFAAVTAAHIGLDPVRDITWVDSQSPPRVEMFVQGKLDAIVGSPTVPQDLRSRRLGHVLANSTLDHPWSQYFCCILSGNSDFVRKYPIATKRVVRAFLKATELCATQPDRVAQRLVAGKFAPRFDYASQTPHEVPYNNWRDYDPDDSLRFYALRMREWGFIRSTPREIVTQGGDWRFLNEV